MITRWVCEKCNKKWIYPVKSCVHCDGTITKKISKETKVIGITKVNIPSPLHPITPYTVLLLQDEDGNRMPKKVMSNYKIGDMYQRAPAKTNDAVSIVKLKYDLNQGVAEALELINVSFSKDDKILIKPSIVEPAYPYQAVNTNPKILDALIEYLKEHGVSDIVVAEQAYFGNDVGAAAKKGEIANVCKKHDVAMEDLSKAEYVNKSVDGKEFAVAKIATERKIINLPCVKTHSQIGVAAAMENLIRLLDLKTQNNMYDQNIVETLPHLAELFPDSIHLGDGSIGLHAQGPTNLGEPAFLNLLYASKNPMNLDAVFCHAGMLELAPYLDQDMDPRSIEVVGDELEAVRFAIKPANRTATGHTKIKLIDGLANPAIFSTAVRMSSKLVGVAGYDVHVAIGKYITQDMVAHKKRIIAFGVDAIEALKKLGVTPLAELTEKTDPVEGIMIVKGILEDPNKKSVGLKDKLTSKLMGFGAKLQSKK